MLLCGTLDGAVIFAVLEKNIGFDSLMVRLLTASCRLKRWCILLNSLSFFKQEATTTTTEITNRMIRAVGLSIGCQEDFLALNTTIIFLYVLFASSCFFVSFSPFCCSTSDECVWWLAKSLQLQETFVRVCTTRCDVLWTGEIS